MTLSEEQKAELERRGWEWLKPSYTHGKWFKMRTNGSVVLNTASVSWSRTDDGRWEGWHGKGDASLVAEFVSIVEGYRLVPEEAARRGSLAITGILGYLSDMQKVVADATDIDGVTARASITLKTVALTALANHLTTKEELKRA